MLKFLYIVTYYKILIILSRKIKIHLLLSNIKQQSKCHINPFQCNLVYTDHLFGQSLINILIIVKNKYFVCYSCLNVYLQA
jgi:hypothetical protein